MTRFIATFAYVGLLRPAPGTWGSAAALPIAYLLHIFGGLPALMIATVLVFAVGWWATAAQTRGKDNHDPSEIVIDEVVGQWIALWPISASVWSFAGALPAQYPGWLLGFAFFRLFDITKPGPVGWADKRADAFGVMFDDVIAGALAALSVIVAALVWQYGGQLLG